MQKYLRLTLDDLLDLEDVADLSERLLVYLTAPGEVASETDLLFFLAYGPVFPPFD